MDACKFSMGAENEVTLVGSTDNYLYCHELTIPSNVSYSDENGSSHNYRITAIADEAFASCRIEKLYLPTSLQWIGYDAFAGSQGLRVMIGSSENSGEPCSIGYNAFGSSPKIYVSANQVKAYQSAWSRYSSSIFQWRF